MQVQEQRYNNIQFNKINHASLGLGYSKPMKIYEKNIIQIPEQSLVSENTLSTNPCKHQYKYPFSESFKTSSVQTYTYISTTTLFFIQENSRIRHAYSKLLLNGCEVEKTPT